MNKNWFGFGIIIILSLMLAGCPPADGAKKPDAAKAGVLDETKPLPPRAALADTPDLYKAKFQITDKSLAGMQADGVPADVAQKLEALKGQDFANAQDFMSAVTGAIGADALQQNRDAIVRHSLSVELAVEPAFPGQPLVINEGVMGSSLFKPIFFDYDQSTIRAEFKNSIAANAEVLKANADMKVEVEGHCDERGTTEYNLALGERRARAVRGALIEAGVSPEQMVIASYGEERPAKDEHNEEAWAINRRAVMSLK